MTVSIRAALLALLLFAACATSSRLLPGQERLVSKGDVPAWATEPVKEDTKDAKAFCGVSHNMASEGEARADALRSAREQIVDAIGTYGTHVLEQVSSSIGATGGILDPAVVMDNSLKLVSEGQVATRATALHVEKWQKAGDAGIEYYYKAYVLVLWDNQAAAETAQAAVREAAKASKDAKTEANVNRALEKMEALKASGW